jgi:hypothetical protein
MNSNVKAKTTTHLNPPSLARARGQLKNESTYDEFILWFALPKYEKVRMRLETQEQFAGYHHLNRHTISEWKKRLDFYPRLKELRNTWGRDRTHNVIVALYHGAISDRPSAARDRELWLKYVEGWR